MKHVYDKNSAFKYTPVADQKRNYLHDKFAAIIREQQDARDETQQKVAGTIKHRVKARTP